MPRFIMNFFHQNGDIYFENKIIKVHYRNKQDPGARDSKKLLYQSPLLHLPFTLLLYYPSTVDTNTATTTGAMANGDIVVMAAVHDLIRDRAEHSLKKPCSVPLVNNKKVIKIIEISAIFDRFL